MNAPGNKTPRDREADAQARRDEIVRLREELELQSLRRLTRPMWLEVLRALGLFLPIFVVGAAMAFAIYFTTRCLE